MSFFFITFDTSDKPFNQYTDQSFVNLNRLVFFGTIFVLEYKTNKEIENESN